MHFSSNFPIFTGSSLLQMDTQALDQSFFLDSTSNSNCPDPWIPTPFNEFTRQFHVNPCHYKSFQTIQLIYFMTFVKILIEVNLDSLPFIYNRVVFSPNHQNFSRSDAKFPHSLNFFMLFNPLIPQPFLPFHFLLCNPTYSICSQE